MATNNSEFLRRRMKELREKNGLTMDEMAKRLGYEQKSTILRVESGKTSYTTLKEFAKKYCETFGMDRIQTEQFLRGDKIVIPDTSALLNNPQIIDELNKEKTTLEDQLNKSEAQTETTESISESTSEKVSLNDLVLVDSKHFDIYEPFTDSYGNNYSIGYRLNASDGASATYSLKGEYKTLEFKIVAGEETGSDVEMSVNVSTDINPNMVNIPKITKLTEVQSKPFGPYDITGARTLTFTTNETGFNSYGHCYLVEAYVSK